MDIVVPKKDLHRLLEHAYPVADKKSSVPVLANALLEAADGKLRVAATDLYLSISGTCSAEILVPGAVAAPARDLFERVRAMSDGPVQITVDKDSKLTVKAVGQARRYTLSGLPGK